MVARRRALAAPAWSPALATVGCLIGIAFLLGITGLVTMIATLAGLIVGEPGPFGHGARMIGALLGVVLIVGLVRTWMSVHRSGRVLDELADQAARVEAG